MARYDHKDVISDGHQWLNEFSHPKGGDEISRGLGSNVPVNLWLSVPATACWLASGLC